MKKNILQITLLYLLPFFCSAQQNITNCTFSLGETFPVVYGGVSSLTSSIGNSGLNQEWNLLELAPISSNWSHYVDTVKLVNAADQLIFAGATIEKTRNFYKSTTLGLEYLGEGGTPTYVYDYSNAELILPSNFVYGSTVTDAFTYTATIFADTYSATGTVSYTVDGTGILYSPGGNFYDVIRVKSLRQYTKTHLNSASTNSYVEENYFWYQNGFHEPLMKISTLRINNSVPSTRFRYLNLGYNDVGIREYAGQGDIKFYPNPAKGLLTINNIFEPTIIEINSSIGQLILKTEISPASNQINISSLSSGVYYVINKQTGFTNKFIKVND